MELYKYIGGPDPLRFGSRMHKSDIDISLHEDQQLPDATRSRHPPDAAAVYTAAFERGHDGLAAAACEELGMKPPGPPPTWWSKPWEQEEADLKNMRSATADELGEEVLTDGVDEAGELTGVQSTVRPDISHPAVTDVDADAEVDGGGGNGGGDCGGHGGDNAGGGRGGEVDDGGKGGEGFGGNERGYAGQAPQIFQEQDEPVENGEVVPTMANTKPDCEIDDATATRLAAAVAQAQDEGELDERKAGRSKPTLALPAEVGGGYAYKRTVVAEMNKLRGGQKRLPTDRLQKVRVAARVMADSAKGRLPKLQPSASAAVGAGTPEGASQTAAAGALDTSSADEKTSDEDTKLRTGTDFAMAFAEGAGARRRVVVWLGRVQKLYKQRGRSKVELKRPLEVDELFDNGYLVLASWYSHMPQRGRYKFNVVADPTPYQLDHFLGVVRLDFNSATSRYELQDKTQQLAALATAARNITSTKLAAKVKKESEARCRGRQNAAHLQLQGETEATRGERNQRATERAGADSAAGASAAAVGAPVAAESVAAEAAEGAAAAAESAAEAVAEGATAAAVDVDVLTGVEGGGELSGAEDDMQPSQPTPLPPPPPPADPDPHRDLSGNATTEHEAWLRRWQGERAWAQCSLSTARNLLRNEYLDAAYLAERQLGRTGTLDMADQGLQGDIRFPDWPLILCDGKLLRDCEVVVRF